MHSAALKQATEDVSAEDNLYLCCKKQLQSLHFVAFQVAVGEEDGGISCSQSLGGLVAKT